jgi:hypothetical protein
LGGNGKGEREKKNLPSFLDPSFPSLFFVPPRVFSLRGAKMLRRAAVTAARVVSRNLEREAAPSGGAGATEVRVAANENSSSSSVHAAPSAAAIGLAALVATNSDDEGAPFGGTPKQANHASPVGDVKEQPAAALTLPLVSPEDVRDAAAHVDFSRSLGPRSAEAHDLFSAVCGIVEDPNVQRSFVENESFQRLMQSAPGVVHGGMSASSAPRLLFASRRTDADANDSSSDEAESSDEALFSSENESPEYPFSSDSEWDAVLEEAAGVAGVGQVPDATADDRDAFLSSTNFVCSHCQQPVPRTKQRSSERTAGCAGNPPTGESATPDFGDALRVLVPLAMATIFGVMLVRAGPSILMRIGDLVKRVNPREWGRALIESAFGHALPGPK